MFQCHIPRKYRNECSMNLFSRKPIRHAQVEAKKYSTKDLKNDLAFLLSLLVLFNLKDSATTRT